VLSADELTRYKRNVLLPGIGIPGQERLRQARVLIIGAGGLGSTAAFYLAAAGVGTLGVADFDRVDLTNLQRQILHTTADIGTLKAESARHKLLALNPCIRVELITDKISTANIQSVIRDFHFIIDATDNFASKFLINDGCVAARIPFSHAGIREFAGQTITVMPGVSACYRCIFHAPPPEGALPPSSELGVLGAVAGLIGTIQATEAIKVITGTGTPLFDALLCCDTAGMDFRKIAVSKNSNCPLCGV